MTDYKDCKYNTSKTASFVGNDFERIFEKLARTDDASTLWINWLDWVIQEGQYNERNSRY